MQVKKFEARSMKEALDMVKRHLGPEAILLSAKEIGGNYGLAGSNSVEVTAAVSESMLRRKKMAEAKLSDSVKEQYLGQSARQQKDFIDKVFQKYRDESYTPPITRVPYVDIDDEENAAESRASTRGTTSSGGVENSSATARERIRSAAQNALVAAQTVGAGEKVTRKPGAARGPSRASSNQEVRELKQEIRYLKNIIERFSQMPQTMSMHPGASEGIPYELSFMYQRLTRAGVSIENTVEILQKAQEEIPSVQLKKKALVDAWVAKFLLDQIQVVENRLDHRYHVFIGPPGQGKTASLVKLASELVICQQKSVAIVTTNVQKIGAVDQLRIYAQILNVPFAVLRRKAEWELIESKLKNVDHILVDFPPSHLKTTAEQNHLKDLLPPMTGGRSTHFVQSVLAKDADALSMAQRYKSLGYQDVIFTFLDESVQHGLIYNFQKKLGVPIHSFGIGPNIPEDFEAATKERFVDLIFRLTKLKKGERS